MYHPLHVVGYSLYQDPSLLTVTRLFIIMVPCALLFASSLALRVEWRPLPHIDRAAVVRTAATAIVGGSLLLPSTSKGSADLPRGGPAQPRAAMAIDAWAAIPVWPVWPTPTSPTGGRVRPITPDPRVADPFLLLAHHKHSFSPGDPLRGPFRAIGGALGLPYVGDEGFKLHPHRGIDIFTIVLDGSDGFRHRDSLGVCARSQNCRRTPGCARCRAAAHARMRFEPSCGQGECTYRGGACQFMRSGKGAMHEEMWETRSDRPTSIELFQIWVNLPRTLKMSPPAIRYVGDAWHTPYAEESVSDSRGREAVRVRTLDPPVLERAAEGEGAQLAPRPPFKIRQAAIAPGAQWVADAAPGHTVLCYVRRGTVRVNGQVLGEVAAGSTCMFTRDEGDAIWLVNPSASAADVLLLTGEPLHEPVAAP